LVSERLRTAKANEVARSDNAQRSLDDFNIVTKLGKGTYGQVYKAVDSSNRLYLDYFLTYSVADNEMR